MPSLFADTHNVVAILEKSDASEFWNTVVVKHTGDVTRSGLLAEWRDFREMGYEKPSTKLTFYKAFFSSQWKFLIHTI
uniref:Uncharacterized protein n=1 Tax=Tanacetum cinerariifolium TaxID=118510 RepID=A0A699RDL4_TANCI|nr:hypothetical protein [Tanacetum cinerariifolium]